VSVQAILAAYKVRGLRLAERVVLMILADYANKSLTCFPSQMTIADNSEMSPRSVWAALQGLQAKGLIEVKSNTRRDGKRSVSSYRLLFEVKPLAKSANGPLAKNDMNHSQNLPKPLANIAEQNLPREPRKENLRGCAREPEGRAPAQDKIQGDAGKLLFSELSQALAEKRRKML
jgi:hypothetical protein